MARDTVRCSFCGKRKEQVERPFIDFRFEYKFHISPAQHKASTFTKTLKLPAKIGIFESSISKLPRKNIDTPETMLMLNTR